MDSICIEKHDVELPVTAAPIHGGEDPDGMNAQRIAWGIAIAGKCHELTGADPEDRVSDAIAYLLHAAPAFGETTHRALERAVFHFNAETGEG
jgi:hypothetical protein